MNIRKLSKAASLLFAVAAGLFYSQGNPLDAITCGVIAIALVFLYF